MDLLYKKKDLWSSEEKLINLLDGIKDHKLGPLKTILRSYKPKRYKDSSLKDSDSVWKAALKSERVQSILTQISKEENKDIKSLNASATKILHEMAYTDHMTLVRLLGFALLSIAKTIYPDGIFVNQEAIEQIKKLIEHLPIVFIPSHRSYMDFLIFSIICFCVDLPLPAIASGMDFMGMKLLGEVLRSSGAFFMRRSFGTDRLYWALFTEYVHAIIVNGDRTMEFFIEGTRSRTGKSLNPKLGLLSVIAEPYLKGQLYDTIIIPVSISYERILEETLYAYELLGVPKPKESTSGLLNAASILNKNYGSIHVKFNKPISLRNHFTKIDRVVHSLTPCHLQHLSILEREELNVLSYKIIKSQQKNMTLTLSPIVALLVSLNDNSISLKKLVQEVQWLRSLCVNCKINIKWSNKGLEDGLIEILHKFTHLFTIRTCMDDLGNFSHRQVEINEPDVSRKDNLGAKTQAVNCLMLNNYKNQILDGFVGPALVVMSIVKHFKDSTSVIYLSEVIQDFSFLCKSLKNDFIFIPGNMENLFNDSIKVLCNCSVITVDENKLSVQGTSGKLFRFFEKTFSPFLLIQLLLGEYFLSFPAFVQLQEVKIRIQNWILNNITLKTNFLSLLSLDLISNALLALNNVDGLVISKVGRKKWMFVNLKKIENHMLNLRQFVSHNDYYNLQAHSKL